MAGGEDPSDLFAVPDFWRSSSWLKQSLNEVNRGNPLFALDGLGTINLEASQSLIPSLDARPAAGGIEDEDGVLFKLPPLFKEPSHQEIKLPCEPRSETLEDEPGPLPSPDDEDIWLSPDHGLGTHFEFQTWEAFDQTEQGPYSPLFVSEVGPAAFDSLLASRNETGDALPDVLDAALYCACLLSLALGRSSILFSWDSNKNSFVKTAPYLRISGLSLDMVKAIDKLCADCGNSARHLQAFAEATYSAASTPTRIALAGFIERLVLVVRFELSIRGRDVRSILQLQSAVQPAQSVLSYFKRLVRKLAQQNSDEEILSCLFQEAQDSEYRDGLLRAATREMLRVISKPWVGFVEEWIGLRAEGGIPITKKGPGKGFIKVTDKVWVDDQGFELQEAEYFLEESKMPTFIPEDMAQTIFETGRNARFLREYHPDHPLSRPDLISSTKPPRLEWKFEWDAISKLEARAIEYRNALSRAIEVDPAAMQQKTQGQAESKPGVPELGCFGKTEAQLEANIISSMRQLDQPLENLGAQDGFSQLLQNQLYQTVDLTKEADDLSPHWTLVPLLSFGPVIEAQSRLINRECMKLLFSSHHLRVHIDALRQYFLLGNGLLCSRLSHALFDPNLSTAERKAGVALGTDAGGVMGLRLGGRKTWPPASSELRLALMGVLTDCYQPPPPPPFLAQLKTHPAQGGKPDTNSSDTDTNTNSLPGDMSFAIRKLSQEEIERCMSDPDALEALDFLRLSYKPPPPLRPVMVPALLVKYDRVFKLLLRLLRMLYVANDLAQMDPRDLGADSSDGTSSTSHCCRTRFGIEARHFIRQVASYFFERGIEAVWAPFERWLDQVQREVEGGLPATAAADSNVDASDDAATAAEAGMYCSPDVLRDRQEQALDEIMGVLLLRKRQAPVMGLLEEIFGEVLRHGFDVDHEAERRQEQEMYKQFRRRVEVFITVCRGLGEKKMAGSTGIGGGADNPVEQLLLMLDMSGFYEGRRKG
ncbi:hypothetical protein N656DRAFT_837210 [Canariomyces notabilis]|uniref:Spindle pole body component n=1 Tax=Canariomyces notabilis TaxID=2074819 RepID=A0AAN6TD60_9PEZI|nr:hypothetical protein N656DRAFT_837210 [Canariomyces arenarius]